WARSTSARAAPVRCPEDRSGQARRRNDLRWRAGWHVRFDLTSDQPSNCTFVALSGFRVAQNAPTAGTPPVEPLADFEFDPFDQGQSTIINDQLRQYGLCLVLESYPYGQPTAMAKHYYQNPRAFILETAVETVCS